MLPMKLAEIVVPRASRPGPGRSNPAKVCGHRTRWRNARSSAESGARSAMRAACGRAQMALFGRREGSLAAGWLSDQNGGYRVPHALLSVTFGDEVPVPGLTS